MTKGWSFSGGSLLLVTLGLLAWAGLYSPQCHAIESTELEPAMDLDAGMLKIEEKLFYDRFHDYELVLENTLEYDFTEQWRLGINVPVGKVEHHDTHLEDTELHLKYVFNPDSESCPVVALGLGALFPTGKHSHGLDEEVCLYLDQHLGRSERNHQLHLNFAETYESSPHDGERRFRYEAVAGYSCDLSPKTIFTIDYVREQLEEHGDNSNIIEVGLKHEFNDTIAVAGGMGCGIGEESPDWQAQLGFEVKLGIAAK